MYYKIKNISYSIVLVIIFCAVLTACNKSDDNPTEKEFTVSFNSNGGTEVPPQTIKKGEKAVKPETAPTLNGYMFVTWYKETDLKTEWKFDTDTVTTNITLYAEWFEYTNTGNEFCAFTNAEDFYKSVPLINAYLEQLLKNNWSDERIFQILTTWLNMKPCIISAEYEVSGYYRSNASTFRSIPLRPPRGTINILLDEKIRLKKLSMEIGPSWPYKSDLWVVDYYSYDRPGEVLVRTEPLSTTAVFDFINLFDFEVLLINDMYYYSTTLDKDDIRDGSILNKPYISDEVWVTGYNYDRPIFSFTFFNMDNKNNQADWLKFMTDYQLFETHPYNYGAFITFLVPEGKESEWATKFLADYEFVAATRLGWGSWGCD